MFYIKNHSFFEKVTEIFKNIFIFIILVSEFFFIFFKISLGNIIKSLHLYPHIQPIYLILQLLCFAALYHFATNISNYFERLHYDSVQFNMGIKMETFYNISKWNFEKYKKELTHRYNDENDDIFEYLNDFFKERMIFYKEQ